MSGDSVTKSAWLHMLREGGRWSSGEMSEVLDTNQGNARGTLYSMVDAGSAKRFEPSDPSGRITFGVTPDCCVPKGVSLNELVQVGILKGAE